MPIKNVTRNQILANFVEIADTPLKRMIGLLGKKSLSQDSALVIRPCKSIHMIFMNFPIDVIFVDQNNKAIGLIKNIAPYAFSPIFLKSTYAIELSAGRIEATQTQIGDHILISNLSRNHGRRL